MQIKTDLLKNDKPAKQEFWLNHVKQWECSNLNQEDYCKEASIKYNTFVYWRGQFLLGSGKSRPKQFAPVEIKQIASDLSQSIKIKLIKGNVVSIPLSMGISEIAKLIRLLELTDA